MSGVTFSSPAGSLAEPIQNTTDAELSPLINALAMSTTVGKLSMPSSLTMRSALVTWGSATAICFLEVFT